MYFSLCESGYGPNKSNSKERGDSDHYIYFHPNEFKYITLEEDKKQREQRNIEITADELKRIETITKLEQTIEQFENSFNILKSGKNFIIQDQTLRSKIEILANRFNMLLQ